MATGALPRDRPGEQRDDLALSEFFLEFSQRTTAHGLRYAVSPEVVRARRLLWLAVFLTTLGYLLYQLAALLTSYHRYPFKTVNKVVPQLSIPYPVVTLCDLNQVDAMKIDNTPTAKQFRTTSINVSYSSAVKDIFRAAHSDHWRRLLNTTMDNYRQQPLHGDILRMRNKEFMELGARTVTETFRQCFWERQEIECSQYISQVFTEAQNCYQFNGHLAGGKMVTRSGYNGGFQAVFTINVAGLTNSVNSDSGYRLTLHDDPGHMHSSAATLLLSPGFIHHVSLQKHTYTFLPLPFKAFGNQHCQDPPQFLAMSTNESYSLDACLFRKIEKKTTEFCNCDPDNCTVDQHLTCYGPTMMKIYSENEGTNEALDCPRPCHMDDYQTQISLSYFPSEPDEMPVKELDPYIGAADVRKSYLGLRLNFKDMIVRVSEHVPEQDSKTLFGAIGGNMGLFLGSSILTLVEVLDFLILLIHKILVSRRLPTRRRETEPPPPSGVFTTEPGTISDQPQIRPVIRTR